MKYRSTRGGVSGLSFEDALYTGYTSDGGIIMPEVIPKIAKDVLKSWVNLSYMQLAKRCWTRHSVDLLTLTLLLYPILKMD
ncbi:hypothetical protein KUTeg_005299 [Tegillarca granosa]|uniref:Threonine synthase N-terminal domain-containing protein n=1 Tax=Tegillarca granosa TaxID=220873 RepID=A0ABQ9FM97_TEGGR|nr:hypothetical protein KUTeg_005299 [Tegillarca granosa]